MSHNEIVQFMDEDIHKINQHPKVNKRGELGAVLGYGTYGFVCEWKDGSGIEKAVKVLDPDYVKKKNSASAAQLNGLLSSASVHLRADQESSEQFSLLTIDEAYASEKLAGTKNKHLMSILDGSQSLRVDNRYVQLIVMPRLMTIEQLPLSESPENQIAEILIQCCEGLHALHEEPEILYNTAIGLDALVHNDLKPDNIFVNTHSAGELSTDWYIIGDYSACLNVKSLNEYAPGVSYPDEIRQNPYCAPGPIGTTSDIWSLGWIMWYWLNGKQHPQREDIESRINRDSTRKPKYLGDNPELWDVFLNMTDYDPARRYQTVDIVQAELRRAMQAREKRLARKRESSSAVSGAAGAAGIAALLYLLVGLKSRASDEKTDAEGYLHGRNPSALPFLDGTFQGEWYHGFPAKGKFVCDGVKKNGSWCVKKDYKQPFSQCGYILFSGLICTDDGEDLYQGKAEIHWNSGTVFETEIRNGSFAQGVMTYRDGTVRAGHWALVHDDRLSGVFSAANDGVHGCGIRFLPGDVCYEGELQQDRPVSGVLVFQNRRIDTDEPSFEKAWRLLTDMEECGCSFSGMWSAEGHPERGKFSFSTGASVSGSFAYAESEEYTGMLHQGKACGIGSHPLSSDMVRHGEFVGGSCSGQASIRHDCGASFSGRWKDDQILEGTLCFSDGTKKYSRGWNLAETPVKSGHILMGLFCDHHKRPCGIGMVAYPPQQTIFSGEVQNGECTNGVYTDQEGHVL